MSTQLKDRNSLYYKLALVVLLLAFAMIKWPYLNLPFYWDEAWVYGPAIQSMTENGPGLLPNSLDPFLSRGHPLIFHFLGSIWGSLFGSNHYSLHLFMLVISLATLYATYILTRNICDRRIALLAVVIVGAQPMFLSQSGLVLPEMMLLLFVLLSLHLYISKKWFWYFVMASAAIMTKESGLIVVCATATHHFLFNLKDLKANWLKWLKRFTALLLPVLPWVIFLIIQKFQNGWMFFPEHVDLVSFDINIVLEKFENYAALLFLYQGRKLLIVFLLIAILYIIIKKVKHDKLSEFGLLLIFVFGFLAFSSLNYYSDRYLLPAVGPLIVAVIVLCKPLMKILWVYTLTVVVSIAVFANMSLELSNSDHNLGYANGVKCHIDVVNFCVKNNLQDKEIVAYFLGRVALSDPNVGYLKPKDKFTKVYPETQNSFDYIIFANFDSDDKFMALKDKHALELVYKTKHEQAWAEVYKKK